MTGLRRLGIVLPIAAVVLLLAACSSTVTPTQTPTTAPGQTTPGTTSTPSSGSSGAGNAAHHIVAINDTGFDPASVTVKTGTRVVWTNGGKSSHQIVLAGGAKSPVIKPGGDAAHVFTKAGTYAYSDGLNPQLKGVVIVQ